MHRLYHGGGRCRLEQEILLSLCGCAAGTCLDALDDMASIATPGLRDRAYQGTSLSRSVLLRFLSKEAQKDKLIQAC